MTNRYASTDLEMKRKAIEQTQAIDHKTDDATALWRTDASVLAWLEPSESRFSQRAPADISMVDTVNSIGERYAVSDVLGHAMVSLRFAPWPRPIRRFGKRTNTRD
jgi:hypothetical protein